MGRPIRVLIIEDSENDSQFVLREIQRGGYDVEWERVERRSAMESALVRRQWDVIICDHSLPEFNAIAALETLHTRGLDLPFIIVSGSISEEAAVQSLKAGAHDFIVKGKLARLMPAIERELRDAKIRQERKQAEDKLRLSDQILQRVNALVIVADSRGEIVYVSPAVKTILDYEPSELLGDNWWKVSRSGPMQAQREKEYLAQAARGEIPVAAEAYERAIQDRSGNTHWILWVDAAGPGDLVIGVGHDITERKLSADQLKYHARLLKNINDAVIATDDKLRITAWNRAAEKMFGWSSQEVIGRNISEILSSELTDEQRAEARELIKESSAAREQRIYQHRDGRILYVEANTIAITDEQNKFTGFVSVNRDITERKQAEAQIQLQLQRLKALHAIDIAISSSFDLSLTLNLLLDQVITQLKTDAAAVLLFDPITSTLEYTASRGFRTTAIRESKVSLGEGYAGKAILERRIINIPNLMETDSELAQALLLKGENFMDYYCVPLIVKGEVKGVLEIFHRSALVGNLEWLDFLATLAGQAAIAIDNASLFKNLQHSNQELFQAYDATIVGWSHALDLRDKETEGHTLRVTEITMELARKFGFTDEQLIHIRWGALLHDIGKLGVPDSILLKPGKLTEEEWAIMKKHPVFALEMLSPIAYLKSSIDIPYCHHEKWDGTGYPRGLKGETIPLAARLFAIVDVWDALRSDRPYRKGWSVEETTEYIQGQAGSHFDPQVVEKFLEIIGRSNG
jgi:PAS domain S-box-containing protein/putative nucleotidyltransferase with HDIG domain